METTLDTPNLSPYNLATIEIKIVEGRKMKPVENQTVEWKQSWRDEYLKWVCAFSNSQGGVLEIGKDNTGRAVGLADPHRLLEDIPNKIRAVLGIIPSVALVDDAKDANSAAPFIRIQVPATPYPVSCHGKYYIRSGSTTQELTGRGLDEFILRRQGKTWDGVPVPNVALDSFDRDAFNAFRRKAIASARMTEEDLRINDALLLDNLRLTESGYLKRAALLLFHQEPERWFTGAYVKIGQFRNAANLTHQDEIHGPLITMPDKVVDLVYLKYFKGIIAYSGIQRTETYPIPRPAFREAVLNAIVHKDYSTGNPVHIHIYPDKVLIYNDGHLPEHWTEADLFAPHTSRPHNPDIANGFFRAGLIEAWGRGIEKIGEACRLAGIPEPHYQVRPNEVMVGFTANIAIGDAIGDAKGDAGIGDGTKDGTMGGTIDGTKELPEAVLSFLRQRPSATRDEIATHVKISSRAISRVMKELVETKQIARTGGRRFGHWEILDTESDTDGIGDRIGDNIGDRIGDAFVPNKIQQEILALMRNEPSISAKKIAETVQIAARNVETNIKHLKKAGLLTRTGSDRKGKWLVK